MHALIANITFCHYLDFFVNQGDANFIKKWMVLGSDFRTNCKAYI